MRIWIFLLCCFFCFEVRATEIKVLDGDSVVMGKREIRLSGIDAPEYTQTCWDVNGVEYDCGEEAKKMLQSLVGTDLSCEKISVDKYRREVCVCEINGLNINKKMVQLGWAVAYDRYTKEYVEDELEAKKAKRGFWQGRFMKPELFRRLNKD